MYESPIKIISDQMQCELEDEVLRVIQKYDIIVDKDELIKALRYDRDQFRCGYKEGINMFMGRLLDRLALYEQCAIEQQDWSARNTVLQIIYEVRDIGEDEI